MSIATITSKGQVTLPKDVRTKLHLDAGEKIDFRVDEESGTAVVVPLNRKVDQVFGLLSRGKRNKRMSVEAMDGKLKERFREEYP